jgi:hypothetical protein
LANKAGTYAIQTLKNIVESLTLTEEFSPLYTTKVSDMIVRKGYKGSTEKSWKINTKYAQQNQVNPW